MCGCVTLSHRDNQVVSCEPHSPSGGYHAQNSLTVILEIFFEKLCKKHLESIKGSVFSDKAILLNYLLCQVMQTCFVIFAQISRNPCLRYGEQNVLFTVMKQCSG